LLNPSPLEGLSLPRFTPEYHNILQLRPEDTIKDV
jgi:hypothetical protein